MLQKKIIFIKIWFCLRKSLVYSEMQDYKWKVSKWCLCVWIEWQTGERLVELRAHTQQITALTAYTCTNAEKTLSALITASSDRMMCVSLYVYKMCMCICICVYVYKRCVCVYLQYIHVCMYTCTVCTSDKNIYTPFICMILQWSVMCNP